MNYSLYLKKLLSLVGEKGASDLHISVGHPPILRISGELYKLEEENLLSPEDTQNLAFILMNDLQREKFLKEKEIDFAYGFELKARFRVNIYYQRGSISIALRIVSAKIKTIEELTLPPVLKKFTEVQQGFVLITGASSQGKSTTLAALIDEINHTRSEHIITIEDPIEYVFTDDKCIIDQRELYSDTLSFPRALRSTLREDPDVIMVGEMRDLETIATALTAAETGHLVFATLHTNSAAQTIHRIVDVFPAGQQNQIRAQLSGSLLGVFSQRLLPRIKEGFIPACEVMICNPAIANLIRENKIHEIPSIIETSAKEGMISLNQYLVELVRKKEITKEIALNYSLNSKELKSRLEKL
ncbi:type IV pili twitching motility protein PilT [bacterium (Candidatus Gribaldobacteria) CG07_land_8_20_14_0_80_33_18]|uniref:Type IV pili twitching motility protein PilT n=1 Tax=bacterium (Candidatus Gribaldobacteria) CG07_land_8_20_14_0_80_33_18 TaxID=2014272 RepID=A0A2M6Z4D8_9BACT|nr:MAG: type IV pili twitching motility protein PilT [bacterium (Candidatus Gribaldobacteria) CG10_big_fil_rev_8_21_14_0_10_33_41]PIU47263.1 MAG: type IV pili twitching motility protein PilT [bacterium (Candidatus Gribaldobacteria) CG07_land_8_20_14_0_80_33_18]PJB08727.1 MAG: type IV pili twitching motility protein PilT [bacterium (Candidatus Gribaldobacteria) CG_4_9_14_3_um_filter_33_9]